MISVIAIDGPAGAGKSTIAKKLAKKLDYRYLDTGAMYRAVCWFALNKNIDITDKEKVKYILEKINISFQTDDNNGHTHIFVNNIDVTEKIRTSKIDKNVSDIARLSIVRKKLVNIQRKIADEGKIVVDGRDIGSRVLPNADLKLYLTASVEERAKRRYFDLSQEKENITLEEVKTEIKKRDKKDKTRKHSPLTKTKDAILIDTTKLTINEVLVKIMDLIKKGDKVENSG